MGRKKKPSIILHYVITYIVLVCFIANTTLSYASSAGAQANPPIFSEIKIPSSIGIISETYRANSPSHIIIIQDRHADELTQLNISSIIDNLKSRYGIDSVYLESAYEKLDASFYDAYPNDTRKDRIARFLVKKAVFTGAELYRITHPDTETKFFGAENRNAYLEHLSSFNKSRPYQKDALALLEQLESIVEKLKIHIYSRELIFLDKKIESYDLGNKNLSEFIKDLTALAKIQNIPTGGYEEIFKFIKLTEKEKGIDFKEAEAQRSDLINKLSSALEKEKLEQLLTKSINFRLNKTTEIEFYSYLLNLIHENKEKLQLKKLDMLLAYCDYIKESSRIDTFGLFKQIDELKEKLREPLFKNDKQRRLAKIDKNISILKNLIQLKLTPQDYAYYTENKEQFDITDWMAFLENYLPQYNIPLDILSKDYGISQIIEDSQEFYNLASERDKYLIENTLKHMSRQKAKTGILVAGGFHTKGITDILKQKAISYTVILPKVGDGFKEDIYKARMKGEAISKEEISEILHFTIGAPLAMGGISSLAGENAQAAWRDCDGLLNATAPPIEKKEQQKPPGAIGKIGSKIATYKNDMTFPKIVAVALIIFSVGLTSFYTIPTVAKQWQELQQLVRQEGIDKGRIKKQHLLPDRFQGIDFDGLDEILEWASEVDFGPKEMLGYISKNNKGKWIFVVTDKGEEYLIDMRSLPVIKGIQYAWHNHPYGEDKRHVQSEILKPSYTDIAASLNFEAEDIPADIIFLPNNAAIKLTKIQGDKAKQYEEFRRILKGIYEIADEYTTVKHPQLKRDEFDFVYDKQLLLDELITYVFKTDKYDFVNEEDLAWPRLEPWQLIAKLCGLKVEYVYRVYDQGTKSHKIETEREERLDIDPQFLEALKSPSAYLRYEELRRAGVDEFISRYRSDEGLSAAPATGAKNFPIEPTRPEVSPLNLTPSATISKIEDSIIAVGNKVGIVNKFTKKEQQMIQQRTEWLVNWWFAEKDESERKQLTEDIVRRTVPMNWSEYYNLIKDGNFREHILIGIAYILGLYQVSRFILGLANSPVLFNQAILTVFLPLLIAILPPIMKLTVTAGVYDYAEKLIFLNTIYHSDFCGTLSEEIVHLIASEKGNLYDLPFATAVGMLTAATVDNVGKPRLVPRVAKSTFNKGRELAQSALLPAERLQKAVDYIHYKYGKDKSAVLAWEDVLQRSADRRLANMYVEPYWTYELGNIIAGIAYEIGIQAGSADAAWEYLRRLMRGEDANVIERKIFHKENDAGPISPPPTPATGAKNLPMAPDSEVSQSGASPSAAMLNILKSKKLLMQLLLIFICFESLLISSLIVDRRINYFRFDPTAIEKIGYAPGVIFPYPTPHNSVAEDPDNIVRVPNLQESLRRIKDMKEEEVHNIPIKEVSIIQQLRTIPPSILKYVKESAQAYNLPPQFVAVFIFKLKNSEPKLAGYGGGTLHNRLAKKGILIKTVADTITRLIPPDVELDPRYTDFFGGVVFEGKTTIGITQMRPAWVRRYEGWKRFGINAETMSDRHISWLLLDPKYSIEAAASMARGLIEQVKGYRSAIISGEKSLGIGIFNDEAVWEPFLTQRMAGIYPASWTRENIDKHIPDPGLLTESNDWILAGFHPMYCDWGTSSLGDQELIVKAGLFDNKPAVIVNIGTKEDEQIVTRLLGSDDTYLREAAKRSLKIIDTKDGSISPPATSTGAKNFPMGDETGVSPNGASPEQLHRYQFKSESEVPQKYDGEKLAEDAGMVFDYENILYRGMRLRFSELPELAIKGIQIAKADRYTTMLDPSPWRAIGYAFLPHKFSGIDFPKADFISVVIQVDKTKYPNWILDNEIHIIREDIPIDWILNIYIYDRVSNKFEMVENNGDGSIPPPAKTTGAKNFPMGGKKIEPSPLQKTVSEVIGDMPYRPRWLNSKVETEFSKQLPNLIEKVRLVCSRAKYAPLKVVHAVLSEAGDDDTKNILENGFDWNRLRYRGAILSGRGIWTNVVDTEDVKPWTSPLIVINFEGNVIMSEEEKEIKRLIEQFLEVNLLTTQKIVKRSPNDPYYYELIHYLFDLLLEICDVDAVRMMSDKEGEQLRDWLVIKNPNAIKSMKLVKENGDDSIPPPAETRAAKNFPMGDEKIEPSPILSSSASEELIAKLDYNKNSWAEIIDAADKLGDMGEQRAVEPLAFLLTCPAAGEHWDLACIHIADALGKLKNPQANKALAILLQNENEQVRKSAKNALLQISPASYYQIQKKRILSALFAGQLEVLIQYLMGEQVEPATFEKIRNILADGYTFDELAEVFEMTGGVESWSVDLKNMREKEVTISEVAKGALAAGQILDVSYSAPQAHFRNGILLNEHFRKMSELIMRALSDRRITFTRSAIEKYLGSDLDVESISAMESVLPFIIEVGFYNANDAIFKRIETSKTPGNIMLKAEIEDGNLLISVSDDGDGIELEKLQQLASGGNFKSDKLEVLAEELARIKEDELDITEVAHNLEKEDIEFRKLNRQLGGRGLGILGSASVIVKYGGILEIETRRENEEAQKLTFKDPGSPITQAVITAGNRPDTGTTFIIRIPVNLSDMPLPAVSGAKNFPMASQKDSLPLEVKAFMLAIEQFYTPSYIPSRPIAFDIIRLREILRRPNLQWNDAVELAESANREWERLKSERRLIIKHKSQIMQVKFGSASAKNFPAANEPVEFTHTVELTPHEKDTYSAEESININKILDAMGITRSEDTVLLNLGSGANPLIKEVFIEEVVNVDVVPGLEFITHQDYMQADFLKRDFMEKLRQKIDGKKITATILYNMLAYFVLYAPEIYRGESISEPDVIAEKIRHYLDMIWDNNIEDDGYLLLAQYMPPEGSVSPKEDIMNLEAIMSYILRHKKTSHASEVHRIIDKKTNTPVAIVYKKSKAIKQPEVISGVKAFPALEAEIARMAYEYYSPYDLPEITSAPEIQSPPYVIVITKDMLMSPIFSTQILEKLKDSKRAQVLADINKEEKWLLEKAGLGGFNLKTVEEFLNENYGKTLNGQRRLPEDRIARLQLLTNNGKARAVGIATTEEDMQALKGGGLKKVYICSQAPVDIEGIKILAIDEILSSLYKAMTDPLQRFNEETGLYIIQLPPIEQGLVAQIMELIEQQRGAWVELQQAA